MAFTEEELQLINATKAIAETDSGKKLLEHLSDYCFEKRSTYVEGNSDKQNVNQGKRAVILHIRDLIETDLNKPISEQVKERDYI